MAHPRMFDDDAPYLADLRKICLEFPEATEVEAWGRPTFRAGPTKMFAVFGAHDHGGAAVLFKPEAADRRGLVADTRFFVPPYFGPSGWLALDLDSAPIDWDEVGELMDASYRQVALKRMLKVLDSAR
ncbi:MAG: MmcQ/YjbR family DNA-binding protein [Actinomycetota bacterium]